VKFGLSSKTIEKLQRVLAHHASVKQAWLFGSRAWGNFQAGSDIDLALEGQAITHAEQLQIMNEIDDLLLPYQVDLLLMKKISNPELSKRIKQDGKMIYQRAERVPA